MLHQTRAALRPLCAALQHNAYHNHGVGSVSWWFQPLVDHKLQSSGRGACGCSVPGWLCQGLLLVARRSFGGVSFRSFYRFTGLGSRRCSMQAEHRKIAPGMFGSGLASDARNQDLGFFMETRAQTVGRPHSLACPHDIRFELRTLHITRTTQNSG